MPNIIQIHDAALPELDVFARLTEAQLRNKKAPEKGLFIAESPKVIERALDAGYKPISFLVEKKHLMTQAKEILEGLSSPKAQELLNKLHWYSPITNLFKK